MSLGSPEQVGSLAVEFLEDIRVSGRDSFVK